MRYLLIVLTMLLCPVSAGYADVSVGFGIPGLNIGINVPAYPDLVQVPGYPVYYDPRSDSHGTTLSHCLQRFAHAHGEPGNQPQRQALPCLAVRPAVQAARRLAPCGSLAQASGYGILAGPIRAQCLPDKEPQRGQGRVDALTNGADFLFNQRSQDTARQHRTQGARRLIAKLPPELFHPSLQAFFW